MDTAFDLKELIKRAEAAGLPLLEEDAEKLAGVFFGWTKESINVLGGLYKTMGLPVIEGLEKLAAGEINKIDPNDNDPTA